MKKIFLLLVIMFCSVTLAFPAVYMINKNGSITNPAGKVQENITVTSQNQVQKQNIYPTGMSSADDDIQFSQAQTVPVTKQPQPVTDVINKVTPTPSQSKIAELKSENEIILKQPMPQLDMAQIERTYGRDPNALVNRLAIQNKKIRKVVISLLLPIQAITE